MSSTSQYVNSSAWHPAQYCASVRRDVLDTSNTVYYEDYPLSSTDPHVLSQSNRASYRGTPLALFTVIDADSSKVRIKMLFFFLNPFLHCKPGGMLAVWFDSCAAKSTAPDAYPPAGFLGAIGAGPALVPRHGNWPVDDPPKQAVGYSYIYTGRWRGRGLSFFPLSLWNGPGEEAKRYTKHGKQAGWAGCPPEADH